MGWSVAAVGEPAAVRAELAKQFDHARRYTERVPHELDSVNLVEQIVNSQLSYLNTIAGTTVEVVASGASYKSGQPIQGSSGISLSVKTVQGAHAAAMPPTPVPVKVGAEADLEREAARQAAGTTGRRPTVAEQAAAARSVPGAPKAPGADPLFGTRRPTSLEEDEAEDAEAAREGP